VQNALMTYRRLSIRPPLNSHSSAILSSGKRFVVRADGKLTAFVELESAVHCARQTVNSGQLLSQKAKRTNANTEKHHGASAVWHADGQVIEGNLCAIKRVISLVMSSARKNTKFHGIDSVIVKVEEGVSGRAQSVNVVVDRHSREPANHLYLQVVSPYLEFVLVLVRLDHIASMIVNADHSIM
jgi:hypothetical protein